MAKRRSNLGLVYFSIVLISIALVGGASYFMINHYLHGSSTEDIEEGTETSAPSDQYVPSVLDNETTLFILDAEKRSSGTCFVLTRLLPEECRLVIVPIQSDTAASLNNDSGTLYDLYRNGGASAAVHSVEVMFGVKVDKYVCFKKDSFDIFSAMMGSINYDVPYNLIYEDPNSGDSTIIRKGIRELDPVTMRKILTFPEYKSGESSRISTVGAIVTDLVNSAQKTRVPNGMDQVFKSILDNGAETDITIYDYKDKKEALIYVAQNSEKAGELMLPRGSYNENEQYVMDEEFVKSVKTRFSADLYGSALQ